jgi:hypothetical protein
VSELDNYLEAAKLEDLARAFQKDGFEVVEQPSPGPQFDLVVQKGDQTIAIEVKSARSLHPETQHVMKLRDLARQRGYSDFRLVVVHPPKATEVTIEGLENALMLFMMNQFPPELDQLSSRTQIHDASDFAFDEVEIGREAIVARGTGAVRVILEYDGGAERDGVTAYDTYPFSFQVELDHNLDIMEGSVNVDTSSFYE